MIDLFTKDESLSFITFSPQLSWSVCHWLMITYWLTSWMKVQVLGPTNIVLSSSDPTGGVWDSLTCRHSGRCLLGLMLLDGDNANCQHLWSASRPSALRQRNVVICHNLSEDISISQTSGGGGSGGGGEGGGRGGEGESVRGVISGRTDEHEWVDVPAARRRLQLVSCNFNTLQ